MNVLHLSPSDFPDLRYNHSTKKIWLELSQNIDEYHILARIKKGYLKESHESNIYLHGVRSWKKSRSFFMTSFKLFYLIKKHQINCIVSQCPIRGGFWAIIAKKIFKLPVLIEIHGMEYFRFLDSKKYYHFIHKIILRYVFKNATKIRSLNSKMTKMLIQRNIKGNIIEIPNRVNLKIFNPPKNEFHLRKTIKIVSVGRFVWEKGYEYLIDAIKILSKNIKVELHIIGGGMLKNDYLLRIGNYNNIHLYDRIEQVDFVPFIKDSDIYIQPSISEGMPRTLLEAMALKLPIITTNVGSISGVMENDRNCLMIEPKNVEQIVKSVMLLIDNNNLRISIAENGYNDVVNKYEWNKVFNKYRTEIISMFKGNI